jgi:hypothetical protein
LNYNLNFILDGLTADWALVRLQMCFTFLMLVASMYLAHNKMHAILDYDTSGACCTYNTLRLIAGILDEFTYSQPSKLWRQWWFYYVYE